MNKEEIVLKNKELGIETVFSNDFSTAGKKEGKVVYLNDNYDDLEMINKHEILHLFEDSKQFKEIKEIILKVIHGDELENLRKEYYFNYLMLYKDEKDINEIIMNEIVIDFIIKNGKFSVDIDNVIKNCYETIVNGSRNFSLNKRYLNLSLSKKIEQQFTNLTKWEKLFVLNYYDGINHKLEVKKETKYEDVREKINTVLKELYKFANDKENFRIYYTRNEELQREFQGEIQALKARGEGSAAEYVLHNKDGYIREMAKKFSDTLQAEYKHIVDFIKNSNYEDAFKYLMLNETLTKVYKQEKVNGDSETIVSKRDNHKSISGHMILNETILDFIYSNLDDYNNFANLYFSALSIFNTKISEKSEVNITGLDTFNKGKWIKFNGKTSDRNGYLKNSKALSSLVQDTPWCTKTLASTHLEQGDFYVFVDNDNKPHLAVKMNGNEIDEVRGLKGGNAQELEDEYREVAIEFLTKNKNIKNGKEWLEKEEWNKRLIKWNKKIDDEYVNEDEINLLLFDLFGVEDYRSHFARNSNQFNLIKKVKNNNFIMDYMGNNLDNLTYGKEWYKTELRNKRLVEWKDKIINETLEVEEINQLLYDLFDFSSYKLNYNGTLEKELLYKINKTDYFISLLMDNEDKIDDNLIYAKQWYEIAKWNYRINSWIDLINNNLLTEDDMDSLIDDLTIFKYNSNYANMTNKKKLQNKLNNIPMVKKYLSKRYGCKEEEICIGDINYDDFVDYKSNDIIKKHKYYEFPYSLVLGDLHFSNSKRNVNMNKLKFIFGNAKFGESYINLNNLKIIHGEADFSHYRGDNLNNLTYIMGDTDFFNATYLKELPKLNYIGGQAIFIGSSIVFIPNLVSVDGDAVFDKSSIEDLSSLQTVKGEASFVCENLKDLPSLQSFKSMKASENIINKLKNDFTRVDGMTVRKR